MPRSLDGESIFLSDADMPPTPPRDGGNGGVAPTILMDGSRNIGGAPINLGGAPSSAGDFGNETVLCDEAVGRCVGWLLAVSGPMIGKSYSLVEGRNSVGRNSSNKVALVADEGISRTAQVYVVYDPDENVYMVTPGDGSAIARLNGKRLDMAADLHHGDYITLSKKTVLRFIPACDSAFKWPEQAES